MELSPRASQGQPQQSEIRLEESPKATQKKKKRRHKHKHRDADIFNIPGVHRMVISELVQKILGCVAGEDVTSENPWIFVKKEMVQDNLESHEESSEFLPYKNEILQYTRSEMLLGYIADETKDYHEYCICVTEEALDKVNGMIEKKKQDQQDRLYNTINKSVRSWKNLGTDAEVDETMNRNNRPLIEVEVETNYPILPNKVQFRMKKAEDFRDGYMELISYEDPSQFISKRRIDAATQVAPTWVSSEVQTKCTYPTNTTTQYNYVYDEKAYPLANYAVDIANYSNRNFDKLSDILHVNGHLNLYTNDFKDLVKEELPENLQRDDADSIVMSFINVNMCKGKMICHAVWHDMWAGIAAISYVDAAPSQYFTTVNTEDEVLRCVHGVNPVLIWSISDSLKPKLILEAPREVYTLSFCPFDENILIGGMKNGQIIIWDLRNRLKKVEEIEVLSTAQQKYRHLMESLMGWMKYVYDVNVVRPTVISDLRFSHTGPVLKIMWSSPYHELTKTGKFVEVPEDVKTLPKQFFTCSEDGTVLVWDILKKPTIQAGGFKPMRRLRRLEKRPSALMIDVSPLKFLHLNLKPLYKIIFFRTKQLRRLRPLGTFCADFCDVKYKLRDPPVMPRKIKGFSTRFYYDPILERPEKLGPLNTILHVGTLHGEYLCVKWSGQDFDSGEIVNSEVAEVLSYAQVHDGPVNSVTLSENCDTILSVGGNVFSMFRLDFPNKSLTWRSSKRGYNLGRWNSTHKFKFTLARNDGYMEVWIVSINSKAPFLEVPVTSHSITKIAVLNYGPKVLAGYADSRGVFRIFNMPSSYLHFDEKLNAEVKKFVEKEVVRKQDFLAWQDKYNVTHFGARAPEDEGEVKVEEEEEVQEKAVKAGAGQTVTGKYVEWLIEKHKKDEKIAIQNMILSKKQLNTKELEKRRKPLQKLDQENERKKQKQKEKLKNADKIFTETIGSLFPEAVMKKSEQMLNPYFSQGDSPEKLKLYGKYSQLRNEMEEYIRDNPYEFEFEWKNILGEANRRRLDHYCEDKPHNKRQSKLKENRLTHEF